MNYYDDADTKVKNENNSLVLTQALEITTNETTILLALRNRENFLWLTGV